MVKEYEGNLNANIYTPMNAAAQRVTDSEKVSKSQMVFNWFWDCRNHHERRANYATRDR